MVCCLYYWKRQYVDSKDRFGIDEWVPGNKIFVCPAR